MNKLIMKKLYKCELPVLLSPTLLIALEFLRFLIKKQKDINKLTGVIISIKSH
jgi:hypothetical protein